MRIFTVRVLACFWRASFRATDCDPCNAVHALHHPVAPGEGFRQQFIKGIYVPNVNTSYPHYKTFYCYTLLEFCVHFTGAVFQKGSYGPVLCDNHDNEYLLLSGWYGDLEKANEGLLLNVPALSNQHEHRSEGAGMTTVSGRFVYLHPV